MPDLTPEKAEVLRRAIAMLPPNPLRELSRERALTILGLSTPRPGVHVSPNQPDITGCTAEPPQRGSLTRPFTVEPAKSDQGHATDQASAVE
ncbi:MAG: hypothetical protein ABSA65_19030 [Acidimicrobiales bacterium]